MGGISELVDAGERALFELCPAPSGAQQLKSASPTMTLTLSPKGDLPASLVLITLS